MATPSTQRKQTARIVGAAFVALIIFGILGSFTIASGIDINTTADIAGTAENMLAAESNLRAKAYLGGFGFMLEIIIAAGLYLLLKSRSFPWRCIC